jgi:hypothetical protein
MATGQGCRVHLRADKLPGGLLIVAVFKHLVVVIDGVIHDTFDPSRDGTRCVYGYFSKPSPRPDVLQSADLMLDSAGTNQGRQRWP